MANMIKNDLGETVWAVGAPGSIERIKCEYPNLIEHLNGVHLIGSDVTKEIEAIKNLSKMERENLKFIVIG